MSNKWACIRFESHGFENAVLPLKTSGVFVGVAIYITLVYLCDLHTFFLAICVRSHRKAQTLSSNLKLHFV